MRRVFDKKLFAVERNISGGVGRERVGKDEVEVDADTAAQRQAVPVEQRGGGLKRGQDAIGGLQFQIGVEKSEMLLRLIAGFRALVEGGERERRDVVFYRPLPDFREIPRRFRPARHGVSIGFACGRITRFPDIDFEAGSAYGLEVVVIVDQRGKLFVGVNASIVRIIVHKEAVGGVADRLAFRFEQRLRGVRRGDVSVFDIHFSAQIVNIRRQALRREDVVVKRLIAHSANEGKVVIEQGGGAVKLRLVRGVVGGEVRRRNGG